MNVLFVTSEVATLFKLGGLADVSYALPLALEKLGAKVTIVMPYYAEIASWKPEAVGTLAVPFDGKRETVFIFQTQLPGSRVKVLLLSHPKLHEYHSEPFVEKYALFSLAVSQLFLYSPVILQTGFDIIHCHDWHTALVPMILGEESKMHPTSHKASRGKESLQSKGVKTLITIHNVMYQGITDESIIHKLGMLKSSFHPLIHKHKKVHINYLREGLEHVDKINTVSPTYANELLTHEYGKNLHQILHKRKKDFFGIINGIDQKQWNPTTDKVLKQRYSTKTVKTKKKNNKYGLLSELGLIESDAMLFGYIGRLDARQKGLDILLLAVDSLFEKGLDFQIVILGTGNIQVVEKIKEVEKKHKKRMKFIHAFDKDLARRIYAGCDSLLVPSRYEPCGLIQMISMRYGTIPLVRKTGGLADTVIDGKTGFVFEEYSAKKLAHTMKRVVKMRINEKKLWQKMITRIMKLDFSWKRSAKKYMNVYASLLDA